MYYSPILQSSSSSDNSTDSHNNVKSLGRNKKLGILATIACATGLLISTVTINHMYDDDTYHPPQITSTQSNAFKASVSFPDLVSYLPGFGIPLETQYAGLLPVTNNTSGNNVTTGGIFYWFFEARPTELKQNTSTPLMVWLNGGPGASSMTGALTEMGPYRISANDTITTLSRHEESWTNVGHMLFFDQPVGTGYSFTNTTAYVSSQSEMATQLYTALQEFFFKHPELALNPVYILGESYAGKYVPYVAHYIYTQNLKQRYSINLKGVGIGNGIMWPVLQFTSVPDFAIALGLIDQKQYDNSIAALDACAQFHARGQNDKAFVSCQTVEDTIYQKYAGNPFVYDVRQQGNSFNDLTDAMSVYFNQDEVKNALHVSTARKWVSIDGSSYLNKEDAPPVARNLIGDEMLDVPNQIFKDLIENYDFLFYAGNMDGSACNNLGIAHLIDRLVWKGADSYQKASRGIWKLRDNDGDDVAGLVKSFGNFSFAVVTNSGHLVPRDQPLVALDMIRRFVNKISFY